MTAKISIPLGAITLMTLAACASAYNNNTVDYNGESSSSEGFLWASSYSSASSEESDTGSSSSRMSASPATSQSKSAASTSAKAGVGCKIGGCSAQLCVNMESDNVISTCEYREAYACYQTARCEKQASGECGWTATAELTTCLQNAS